MKKILFLTLLFSSITFAQKGNYFVNDKDTVYTKGLSYDLTIQSYLAGISYTDLNGNHVELKGRKNLENVSTFSINGRIKDKIPQKANKPKSYVKWADRVVDGKLIVNHYGSMMVVDNISTGFMGGRPTTSTITKLFVRMPDGTFYDLNKSSDRKKYIMPYLQQCEAFKAAFVGKFSGDYIIDTIQLYNSLCR